jgi:glycosyltransferase involved in cell wall biosynthesis
MNERIKPVHSDGKRKLLVIVYYFPPFGGVGVHRASKFCKYLPSFGWHPIVLTPKKANYEIYDYSLIWKIDPDTPVVLVPNFDRFLNWGSTNPFCSASDFNEAELSLYGRRSFHKAVFKRIHRRISKLLVIPDDQCSWVPLAVWYGMRAVKLTRPSVLFTTGSPFSEHLIGMILRKLTGIPWVADFRDPWSINPKNLHMFKARQRIERKLEEIVMRTADLCTYTSKGTMLEMQEEYPEFAHKIVTITNSFDRDDFSHLETRETERSEKTKIVYTGRFHPGREPVNLFKSLGEILRENPQWRKRIEIQIAGGWEAGAEIHPPEMWGLEETLVFSPHVEHKKSIEMINDADYLLLTVSKEIGYTNLIPAKLFEYLGARKPIIAILPINSPAAQIVRETKAGITLDPDDIDGIKRMIYKILKGEHITHVTNEHEINRYSSEVVTEQFVQHLEKLVEQRSPT